MTAVFVDNKIPQYDLLLNSLIVNHYDFNFINKGIMKLNELNRIGFIWENNYNIIPFGTTNYKLSNGKFSSFFSDEFIKILKLLNAGTIIDLITCELKSQNFKNELNLILQEINITINYSVNLTSNPPYGDWIMESSNENISFIYFNSNIEKFTSILLATGQVLPNNGNIYSDVSNSYTYQLNITSSWSDITTYGIPTTIFNSNIDDDISPVINIGFNFKLATQTYSQFRISTNGSLFFGINGSDSYELSPSIMEVYPVLAFMCGDMYTELNGIRSILTSDFLLIQSELSSYANRTATYISQIFLYKTGKIEIKYQTTNSNYSFYVALCYSSTNYYSLNTLGQIIYNQDILVNDAYLNNKTLTINNSNIISNICFIGSTPITTNQGNIPINKINPLIHTIRNKKILRITETTTQDKYLVCFEKDSLAPNIPSQKTIISNYHCIYYQGKIMQAKDFIGKYENVKNIIYSGETLYNVLMEDHEKMLVNNLICETLNPNNKIVKVYKFIEKLNSKEQESFIKANNKYVIDNKIFCS